MFIDNLHIRIFEMGWVYIYPARWKLTNVQDIYWRFYQNEADGAIIKLTEQGNNKVTTIPLSGGKAYFIPAGVHFDTDIDRKMRHFYVHFDVLGISEVAMRTIFNRPIYLPASSSDWLPNTANEIATRIQNEEPVEDVVLECGVKALIYEGLRLYLQSLPSEELSRAMQLINAVRPVLPAINYIRNNLTEQLINHELAEMCNMSEDYFIRRFKECLSQTPGDYIREQRVKLSAQQLLFSVDTIEQIAADTGFGSRYYLSRVFKSIMGISPAAYRKATRI